MTKSKPVKPGIRVLAFMVGMGIAIFLIVYSIRWEDLPIQLTMAGSNVTPWAMAGIIVLFGIVAGTLIKSALLGKWRLD